ncbi:MAG TPA: hypothetical protein VHY91_23830 [Pirellulales bacterium]|jgi:hypothetical protein|nr:hypothetical protein [Pirellulales bacterium]
MRRTVTQHASLLVLAALFAAASPHIWAAGDKESDAAVNGAVRGAVDAGSAPADLSDDALVAAVVGNYASIESIYCQYTVRYLATADRKASVPMNVRYARSGTKWRLVQFDESAGVLVEVARCCDGEFVYSFSVTHRDGKPQWSGVQIHDRAEPGGFNPEHLIGRNLSNVGRSIPEILKQAGISRSGAKLPGGTVGERLSVSGLATSRAKSLQKYDVVIAVDPEHDFLPREIRITEAAENVTWPDWAQKWNVDEFQQVVDQKSRRQRWFPASGLLTQGTTAAPAVKIVVEKVRINATLPETLFKPEFPDGLSFMDATADHRGRGAVRGNVILENPGADPPAE